MQPRAQCNILFSKNINTFLFIYLFIFNTNIFLSLSLSLQYNFVGRILGPRGLTAKQLEAETGCKIMVRGKSSMRDKKKVRHTDVCWESNGPFIIIRIPKYYPLTAIESIWDQTETPPWPDSRISCFGPHSSTASTVFSPA